MRKIKKCLALFLVICMTITFSACVTKEPPTQVYDEIMLLNTASESANTLSGVDALGRSFDSITSTREKYVGMFYFTWMGQSRSQQTDIYDTTKLMQTLGDDFFAPYGTADSPVNQFHFWGEPLFGYYNSRDTWVMRRHLEMLTMAGVDFLVFDATNQFMYDQVWKEMLPIMDSFLKQGFKVPKIAFYTNTDSVARVTEIYNSLYAKNFYPDTWFKPQGKPLIIMANKASLSSEIKDFFDFRNSQWPGLATFEDGFPWIDFNRPQEIFAKGGANGDSIMSVAVSQHPKWPFSDSIAFKNVQSGNGISKLNADGTYYNENWGRGYSDKTGRNDVSKIPEGINFQEQWDYALDSDPNTVFVTGWNEWQAIKFYEDISITTGMPPKFNIPQGRRVFMVDSIDAEFSRDVEPMRGGFGDNYYMQLTQNIRKYKGINGEAKIDKNITIDVSKSVKQWESVTNSYRDFVGDAVARNYDNAAETEVYIDNSNRNDISETRIATDDNNVYVMVSTDKAISKHILGDTKWMNMLINIEGNTNPSFEGYQFIINRNPTNNKTSIEKSKGGFDWENIGDVQFSVQGKYIQFAIPKSLLGISSNFKMNFKICDNITKPNDIMEYYISGDSAPIGRFNYTYNR